MKKVNIKPGELAFYQGAKIKIRKIVDLKTVLVENVSTGATLRINVKDLNSERPAAKSNIEKTDAHGSAMSFTQEEWDNANKKYEIIKPALANMGDGEIIAKISEKWKIHRATLYRWIEKYSKTESIISLAERRGQALKNKSKFQPDVEEIIKQGIETIYLKKGERKKIKKVIEYVEDRCRRLGISAPHANSIRNRIKNLDDYRVTEARYGRKVAKQNFDPNYGEFPDPGPALSTVQIDHTPLDIILVDPVYREPIGKPWLTSAIDVTTRMTLGYYMSFDAPNYMSVALCLSSAVLPKEKKLKELGINGDWPCWGFMNTIHSDNGKEFHSASFKRACDLNHIAVDHRPIKAPHWGGHIESWHKTLENEVHNLPGTTFSNVKERGNYPSEKNAALTFQEFEKWFVTFVVNVYHQRIHSKLMKSPIKEWEDQLVGTNGNPGIGYPSFPDEEKTRIEFLPIFHRTIQEYGVANNSIDYYSDVLKKWIHKKDIRTGKARLAKKHEFRWDPRDLSLIYFFDEELNEYYEIPYRNLAHPSITIWELRAIKRKLKELGERSVDEEKIFRALAEMNAIEEQAIHEKKKVKAQRLKARKQNSHTHSPKISKASKNDKSIFDEVDISKLEGFD